MSDTNNGNGQQQVTERKMAPLVVSGNNSGAIIPKDVDQAWRLAGIIDRAGMAPKSFAGKPEAIMVAIMHGMEVGLSPMAALQSIAVVNGMPTIWGDGALGLVRASGLVEDFQELLETDKEGGPVLAICTVKRKGESSPITRTFGRADAQKAGLWGKQGPWTQYPQRMMAMRARSWALRDGFADVLRGLHIREEVADIPQTLERGNDGTYTPQPRPTRAEFQQSEVADRGDVGADRPAAVVSGEDAPVATGQSPSEPAADFNAWTISAEAFKTLGKFSDEWRRNLDLCETAADVAALVDANADRLEEFGKTNKAAVGALQADADSRAKMLKTAA